MDRLKGWAKQIRALLRKGSVERELDEEMRFHLEMEAERLIHEEGVSKPEASRRAALAFGGVERYKEEVRDARWTRPLEDLVQDLRYALRKLNKRPGFTAAAVLTLTLGIGATTAVFSAVHAVLLRPLPIAEQDRVVMLWKSYPERDANRRRISLAEFQLWRDNTEQLEGVAAYNAYGTVPWPWEIEPGGAPELIPTAAVTHEFFSVLGAEPMLGRTFDPDDRRNAAQVVVVSNGFWQRHFGADPEVAGQATVRIGGTPRTVVGVMPPGFDYPQGAQIWLPRTGSGETPGYFAVGRLKPGATVATGEAELTALTERYAADRADPAVTATIVARPLEDTIVGELRPALLILMGAVALVLLIACANVANLLLVRAGERRREFAVRLSLGATRGRIVRQHLAESALLALVAGILGVFLAWWGLDVLLALVPEGLPRMETVAIDSVVLGFTLVASLATAVGFGVMPALHTQKRDLTTSLKEGRGRSAGRPGGRLSRGLVVGELALAVVLLVGAGLLVQSFVGQLRLDRGLPIDDLLVATAPILRSDYPTRSEQLTAYEQLRARIAALPGVVSTTQTVLPPFLGAGGGFQTRYTLDRQRVEASAADENPLVNYAAVPPGHFRTLGIPLLRGRAFGPEDRSDALNVAVVSRAMVERVWPDADPIGRRIQLEQEDSASWRTVVGVVEDIRYRDAVVDEPSVYVPLRQTPAGGVILLIRTASDAADLVTGVRREIRAFDSSIPVNDIVPLDEHLATALARPRFSSVLLTSFSTLALVLAAIGVYGVMAAFVGRRTREIGIRKALGARRGQVLRRVIGEGAVLAGLGLLAGIVAAVALTRLLSGLLHGVSPTDPITFAGVALILAAVALLASYVPARRAARVDPMIALRVD